MGKIEDRYKKLSKKTKELTLRAKHAKASMKTSELVNKYNKKKKQKANVFGNSTWV